MEDYEALPQDEELGVARPPGGADDEHHRCGCKVVLGFLVLVALVTGVVYVGTVHEQEVSRLWHSFLKWCETLGWKAGLVVAVLTWLATTFALPASAFFVGSAAVFSTLYGPTIGALAAIVSCGLGFWAGCVCAFAVARHLLGSRVRKQLDEFEAMRAVNMIIEEEGWKFAFLMRLSPFMPVEVFNFVCALTPMTFRQNMFACLGSLPTASFEMWMYAQVAGAAVHGRGRGGEPGSGGLLLTIAVNAPIVVVLVLVVRHANRKYHEKVDGNAQVPVKDVLKDRKSLHQAMRKASTFRAATEALGTHQAISYTMRSLGKKQAGSIPRIRSKTMQPHCRSVPDMNGMACKSTGALG